MKHGWFLRNGNNYREVSFQADQRVRRMIFLPSFAMTTTDSPQSKAKRAICKNYPKQIWLERVYLGNV